MYENQFEAKKKIYFELLDKNYKNANSYSNLVIVAGYAAYFAIWKVIENIVDGRGIVLSALFMVFSCVIFVLFEIAKMFCNALFVKEVGIVLRANRDDFETAEGKLTNYQNKMNIWMSRVWFVVLVMSIGSASIGIGIELYYMIKYLCDRLLPQLIASPINMIV